MTRAFYLVFFIVSMGFGITLSDNDLTQVDVNDTSFYSYENSTDVSIEISSALGTDTTTKPELANIALLELNASATNATISFDGSTTNTSIGIGKDKDYAFNILATELKFTGKIDDKNAAHLKAFYPSKIQANATFENAKISLKSTNAPALSIQGNFTAKNSLIEHYETSSTHSSLVVSGTSAVSDSEFSVISNTTSTQKPILRYVVMSSLGGFSDFSNNTASIKLSKSIEMLEQQYSLSILDLNTNNANLYKEAKDNLFTATLKQEGTNIIIEKSLGNLSFKDIERANLKTDIALIDEFLQQITTGDESDRLKALKTFLTSKEQFLANKTDAELLAPYNQANNPAGDIVLSALNAHQNIKDYIGLNLANDTLYNNAQGVVQEIVNNAHSSLESAKANSSTINAINVSNDMAISTRLAAAYNPYSTLAALNGKYFATTDFYPALYYANLPYDNGVWVNAFGGANIIEGNSGALYGISVGYDEKILDNALLGVYFSYANATIKDEGVEQSSNNYQLGLYSSFNPLDDIELNLKFYGQLATTEQTRFSQLFGEMKGDFTRHFAGLSFNGGQIFAFDNNMFFLKPFLGVNYYYAYTPSYIEKGNAAQDVKNGITHHSASAEFGVDLRQYTGQNSFLYITPKLEQYFAESTNDYVAGFLGSTTTFTIKANKLKKTYAQIIMGGNFNVSENFNVTLGFGFKQALKCACQSKSETYLSGNLGLRYQY